MPAQGQEPRGEGPRPVAGDGAQPRRSRLASLSASSRFIPASYSRIAAGDSCARGAAGGSGCVKGSRQRSAPVLRGGRLAGAALMDYHAIGFCAPHSPTANPPNPRRLVEQGKEHTMRLILHYRGPLRAHQRKSCVAHQHEIRLHFHRQLKLLWNQEPLSRWLSNPELKSGPGNLNNRRQVGDFDFAPLVIEELYTVAELDVVLLRPEKPGGVIRSGDIDNRLKTLFDALSCPQQPNQVPDSWNPTTDEQPVFCLLADDKLVTSVSVRAEQLLEPTEDEHEVDMTITVRTRVTEPVIGNGLFAV